MKKSCKKYLIKKTLLLTIAICDKSRVDLDEKYEKSAFQKWSGAQNFAFSVIMEFLELQDIVKMMIISRIVLAAIL
jgi:hypothetical protein